MNLILDTHILLWALATPAKIPRSFRERLELPSNTVMFSAVSILEIAVKLQIGRFELPFGADGVAAGAERMGFRELPVTAAHAAGVQRLPLHHRDPFDRLLIAQATNVPARLLTVDRVLAKYSDLVDVGS
jgi:PIN domain nuclease of toxin-antitoxin system